jgi:hypothetical protein
MAELASTARGANAWSGSKGMAMTAISENAIDYQRIAAGAHRRAARWTPQQLAQDAYCLADAINAQEVSAYFSRRSRDCLFALIGDGTGEE